MLPKVEGKSVFHDGAFLSKNVGRAYQAGLFNDLTVNLEGGETLSTSKYILASSSEYFAAMLFGGLKEGNSDEISLNCDVKTFRTILNFLFLREVDFAESCTEVLLTVMEKSREMRLDEISCKVQEYLVHLSVNDLLEPQDCLTVAEFSLAHKFENLTEAVLDSIKRQYRIVMEGADMENLSEETFLEILSHKEVAEFPVPEIAVFKSIADWCENHPAEESIKEELLSFVRWEDIGVRNLLHEVRTSGILTEERILDLLSDRLPDNVGYDTENVNVCARLDTKLLLPSKIIDLRKVYLLNKLEFVLERGWKVETRRYTYTLTVSRNKVQWEMLLDCSQLEIRGRQTICFPCKRIRYISIQGKCVNNDTAIWFSPTISACLDTVSPTSERFTLVPTAPAPRQ